ncbi:MAG: hypothetical protein QNI87_06585 [Erythrobacter sp.]|uniref:hypothetical protein n=1 Tax=Erythrobacter sp. TaxID=1042 RepID=UPI00263A0B03|nr:hypothetical protein [Erythrobacter sp.]MDJ0978184.1 hypothetical protein [Erythrobacter sp.]
MHDLARIAFEETTEVDWGGTEPVLTACTGGAVLHLKLARADKELTAKLRLPEMGLATESAMAIGPAEWLLFCDGDVGGWRSRIEGAPAGIAHALSDASDRLVRLRLARDPDILSGLTGLPADAFDDGRCARTRMGQTAVVVASFERDHLLIIDRAYERHFRLWWGRAL